MSLSSPISRRPIKTLPNTTTLNTTTVLLKTDFFVGHDTRLNSRFKSLHQFANLLKMFFLSLFDFWDFLESVFFAFFSSFSESSAFFFLSDIFSEPPIITLFLCAKYAFDRTCSACSFQSFLDCYACSSWSHNCGACIQYKPKLPSLSLSAPPDLILLSQTVALKESVEPFASLRL